MRLPSQRWSSRGFRYSYTASRPVQTSSGSSHHHVGVKPTRESCARLEPSTRYQSTIPRSQLLLLGWGAWEWDERGPTGLLISWGSCEGIFAACNLKPTSSCVCLAWQSACLLGTPAGRTLIGIFTTTAALFGLPCSRSSNLSAVSQVARHTPPSMWERILSVQLRACSSLSAPG